MLTVESSHLPSDSSHDKLNERKIDLTHFVTVDIVALASALLYYSSASLGVEFS